jgi:hypothetical protein
MNIENLTLKQIREIAALVGNQVTPAAPHPFVGKYVICRCFSAGVHAGVLVSQTGDQAVLKDSRRLWSWTAKAGIALSGVAVHGLKGGKVDTQVDEIALTGVIETIPTSGAAQESIRAA